jgi:hypothetical protein
MVSKRFSRSGSPPGNRALSDHLKAAAQGIENLHAMTFHQLCDWRVGVALSETGKDQEQSSCGTSRRLPGPMPS